LRRFPHDCAGYITDLGGSSGRENALIGSAMFPFRKILLPVDYSPRCEAVVPYVKEMIRRFSGDLTVVHAYGFDVLSSSELPVTELTLAEEAQADEERRLHEFALQTFPGQHVECFAALGEPGGVIGKIVQHQSTDLVMLATHGRGPIRRFLLGSVAAKMLHDLDCAVWTGVGSVLMDHAPQIPYKTVLCALDESDEAGAVLTTAASLACNYQAQLHIVHVLQTPPPSLEVDFTPCRNALMDAADFRLRELKGQLGINAPHAIVDGLIPDGLREEALRRRADLVITGRGHAHAKFTRMWSHVYPIVRESPCPVLSV
jgi:nucleotide-binding universal stress UspA family protein